MKIQTKQELLTEIKQLRQAIKDSLSTKEAEKLYLKLEDIKRKLRDRMP